MRQYKLVLVARSSLKDADRKKLLGAVKEMLGKVKEVKESEMGQKPLSYPIKKEVSGIFTKMEFELETIPLDFEKRLFGNEDILRHLLIKV
jgi:ribosomal protein S6